MEFLSARLSTLHHPEHDPIVCLGSPTLTRPGGTPPTWNRHPPPLWATQQTLPSTHPCKYTDDDMRLESNVKKYRRGTCMVDQITFMSWNIFVQPEAFIVWVSVQRSILGFRVRVPQQLTQHQSSEVLVQFEVMICMTCWHDSDSMGLGPSLD